MPPDTPENRVFFFFLRCDPDGDAVLVLLPLPNHRSKFAVAVRVRRSHFWPISCEANERGSHLFLVIARIPRLKHSSGNA